MGLFNSRNSLITSGFPIRQSRLIDASIPDRLPPAFLLNGQYIWNREAVDR